MNKEEQLLEKRLIELSNLAFSRDIVTFSDFLNLNELNILHRTPKDQFKARLHFYLMLFIMTTVTQCRLLRSVR